MYVHLLVMFMKNEVKVLDKYWTRLLCKLSHGLKSRYTYSSKQKLHGVLMMATNWLHLASCSVTRPDPMSWTANRIDCSMVLIIATSFANNCPKSLAVVFAATFSAYPLNQQLLQYVLGYFSIFVHTHDGYLRYISKITHRYARNSRDN